MSAWSRWSAGLGAAIWLAWLPRLAAEQGQVAALLLFAVLVLVPLALALAATPDRAGRHAWPYRAAVFAQPAAALLAAGSFLLPPSPAAALLALPWLLCTGLVALFGLWRLLPRGLSPAAEVCLDAGLVYLPIGGAWLVLARLGARPLGFSDVIVLLTAVHFHYAGFVAPLLAAMAGRALPDRKGLAARAYRAVAAGVVAGPPLLAAGFTFSPALRFAAALLLAASLLALAALTMIAVLPAVRPRAARWLLGVSAAAIILPMLLVGAYAVGELAGASIVTIPQMVRVHGWLNALGFALCGLLAWTLRPPASQQSPPGLPLSRLVSRGRVGSDFLWRINAVAESGRVPTGLVDDFSIYRRDDFDPARVHPAIRAFYEQTVRYSLVVRAEWRPGFRLAARVWRRVSTWAGQESFRVAADRADEVVSQIVPIKDEADGRQNVRAWVRTYSATGEAMYVAVYANHTLGSQTYMNIAFPWPGGNQTSILRIEAYGTDGASGILLTTRPGSGARGDEGVYFVTPVIPVRLPLNETIRVWVEEASSGVLGAASRAVTVLARHDFWFLGIPCLTLHYRILPRDQLGQGVSVPASTTAGLWAFIRQEGLPCE
ncbi:MAG TPA: YndJ family protein [Chloroflexota bacterium]|nr:YndJ family protein [Chloroflexota bacterium]